MDVSSFREKVEILQMTNRLIELKRVVLQIAANAIRFLNAAPPVPRRIGALRGIGMDRDGGRLLQMEHNFRIQRNRTLLNTSLALREHANNLLHMLVTLSRLSILDHTDERRTEFVRQLEVIRIGMARFESIYNQLRRVLALRLEP